MNKFAMGCMAAGLTALSVVGVFAEGPGAPEYRVTRVEGDAGFTTPSSRGLSPLREGLSLQAGDQVVTGENGRVELATKAGTVMELQAGSALNVESFSGSASRFFLRVGRLLGKFAPSPGSVHSTNIRTPVAVAAVRGTELIVDVAEDGETSGAVLEGQVAFGPLERPVDETPEADSAPQPDWSKGESVIETSGGIVVAPMGAPVQLAEIPAVVAADINRFPHLRERIPHLRDQWKDMSRPEKLRLRRQALRDQIRWEAPARVQPHLRNAIPTPSERIKVRPASERRRPSPPAPQR